MLPASAILLCDMQQQVLTGEEDTKRARGEREREGEKRARASQRNKHRAREREDGIERAGSEETSAKL